MDNKFIKTIEACRVCGSKNLLPILSLGEQYVSNFIDAPSEQLIKAPLTLVLCDSKLGGCGLLQLKHTVSASSMYDEYWYKSGLNPAMRSALSNITEKAGQIVKLSAGDVVLDIGANDGTLLRTYPVAGLKTYGFEPAKNLVPEASINTTKIINDFFNAAAYKANVGSQKAKVITSIAMFYDLDAPNTFVADIVESLDGAGIWIIQMSYLPLMLEYNNFDNICHEHLEYYSLFSLEALLKRHNLEVFDIELNDVNGGSFRVYIQKTGAQANSPGGMARVAQQREVEQKLRLNESQPYAEFAVRVAELKKQTCNFIRQEVAGGKKVYVYGASTKGNTILQYYGLDSSVITAAARLFLGITLAFHERIQETRNRIPRPRWEIYCTHTRI